MRITVTVLASFGVSFLAACSAPRRTWVPPQDPAQLSDTAFLHYLATAPTVTVDEGSRAVLLLIGPTDRWPAPERRAAELSLRGALRAAWRCSPDNTLDKGTLAYMLVAISKLPQGVNGSLSRFFGLGDRRYALKTCIYYGILPYGLPHDPVTGGELLSALTAAESRVPAEVSAVP